MKYYISLLLILTFISCSKDDEMRNFNQNENDIIQYLNNNNLNATRTENGVHYIIDEVGSEVKPTADDYVTAIYTAYFLDGTKFDNSDDNGALFDLQNVIPGFTEGITNFSEGSKGTMYIPPSLAYGSSGVYGAIPQNAVLKFEVEVVKVRKPQTENDIIIYLEENNLQAERSETGLYYIIEEQGTGNEIDINNLVRIKYEATFLDGTVFDSSENGMLFDLNRVIPGFSEGVTYFNQGGKGTLIIPPSLAYGEKGIPNRIPRNSVLIFNIDIEK